MPSKEEDNKPAPKSDKGKDKSKPVNSQSSGIVDLFKGDNDKMTVVFHSLLAPHFKYESTEGDRICMRFGGVRLGKFDKDLVELQQVRFVVLFCVQGFKWSSLTENVNLDFNGLDRLEN